MLVLVRRRSPFVTALVRALKERGVDVAGSDRMRLVEQLAVEDMMALLQFLLLPEDDLNLASVLKGPLFGFDEERLFQLPMGAAKEAAAVGGAAPAIVRECGFRGCGRVAARSVGARGLYAAL